MTLTCGTGEVLSVANQMAACDGRLLSRGELQSYSQCINYTATPPGNLINTNTRWDTSGSLIQGQHFVL